MNGNLKALVITGDGINCESETALALKIAGFDPKISHINDLVAEKISMDRVSQDFAVIALPGGFSFGDDLTSGRILALKIKHQLQWNLNEFASRGGLVIGICNGFQALIRLGIFGKSVSITSNLSGKFLNDWVLVKPSSNKCVWFKGLGSIVLPIRHGEGRIVLEPSSTGEVLQKLDFYGMSCLKYELNPNGSEEDLAGLCDSTGRILGMMPHPEAYIRWTSHPSWTKQPTRSGAPGEGLQLFENAFQEARGAF